MKYIHLFIIFTILISLLSSTAIASSITPTQPYLITYFNSGTVYTITVSAINKTYYKQNATLTIIDTQTDANILSQPFVNSTTVIQPINTQVIVAVYVQNKMVAYTQITPYIPVEQNTNVSNIAFYTATGITFALLLITSIGLHIYDVRRLEKKLIEQQSKLNDAYQEDMIPADIKKAEELASMEIDDPFKKSFVLKFLENMENRGLDLRREDKNDETKKD